MTALSGDSPISAWGRVGDSDRVTPGSRCGVMFAEVSSPASCRSIEFLNAHRHRSPLLVVDLDVVAHRYAQLAEALPDVAIFYAVKANPAPEVLRLLVSLGSSFDVASIGEVEACLAAGATSESLSFGNTVKKRVDIERAYELGVRRYAFDSDEELDKLIAVAPGSTVFCRVLCDGFGAAWPLSRKFGCSPDFAVDHLRRAARHGLEVGASFHVGSQQFDVHAWDRALAVVADIRAELRADGIEMRLVNLGGGLPGTYVETAPDIEQFGEAIQHAIRRRLGPEVPPEVLIEPGRFLVADAGTIRCEVVTVARKSATDDHRWVYLDIGMFSGLAEVMDEAIRYRVRGESDVSGPTGPVVLAGPTCDSADVLYQKTDYQLPLSLAAGDAVYIDSCGAYTTTYSTIGFNGFDPLDVEILTATTTTAEGIR
jgi:ornithine decarboxylase